MNVVLRDVHAAGSTVQQRGGPRCTCAEPQGVCFRSESHRGAKWLFDGWLRASAPARCMPVLTHHEAAQHTRSSPSPLSQSVEMVLVPWPKKGGVQVGMSWPAAGAGPPAAANSSSRASGNLIRSRIRLVVPVSTAFWFAGSRTVVPQHKSSWRLNPPEGGCHANTPRSRSTQVTSYDIYYTMNMKARTRSGRPFRPRRLASVSPGFSELATAWLSDAPGGAFNSQTLAICSGVLAMRYWPRPGLPGQQCAATAAGHNAPGTRALLLDL